MKRVIDDVTTTEAKAIFEMIYLLDPQATYGKAGNGPDHDYVMGTVLTAWYTPETRVMYITSNTLSTQEALNEYLPEKFRANCNDNTGEPICQIRY